MKPVPVGSSVYFPNKDNVRHHVYSFSPAKRFELPLYTGTPAEPVVFDRPGIVAHRLQHPRLDAGLHLRRRDAVRWPARAPSGQARLDNLPAGRYVVRIWHPRMEGTEDATSRPVSLDRTGASDPHVAGAP